MRLDDCASVRSLHAATLSEFSVLAHNDDATLTALYCALHVAPLRRLTAYGLPSEDALRCVAAFSPAGVCDLGAGAGLWAHLLRRQGVPVSAYDVPVTAHNGYTARSPLFTPVHAGSHDTATAHREQTLLLCWPPEEDDADAPEAVRLFGVRCVAAYTGDTVVHVGEHRAGSQLGDALRRDFRAVETLQLPRWPGAGNVLTVWRRAHGRHPAPSHFESNTPVRAVRPSLAGLGDADAAAAAHIRSRLFFEHRASWSVAAASHIAARVLSGGPRAREGPERGAVAAAAAAGPLLRRLALRLLC